MDTGLAHPEWVNGRRLWFGEGMGDVLHKLNHGDPAKGWEGDPNLAVYYSQPTNRWEIWRLEPTGRYELVCRSAPGVVFHEGVIDMLMARDQKYRTLDLHREVTEHNARVDADKERQFDEYIEEDVVPAIVKAFRKDAGW